MLVETGKKKGERIRMVMSLVCGKSESTEYERESGAPTYR